MKNVEKRSEIPLNSFSHLCKLRVIMAYYRFSTNSIDKIIVLLSKRFVLRDSHYNEYYIQNQSFSPKIFIILQINHSTHKNKKKPFYFLMKVKMISENTTSIYGSTLRSKLHFLFCAPQLSRITKDGVRIICLATVCFFSCINCNSNSIDNFPMSYVE